MFSDLLSGLLSGESKTTEYKRDFTKTLLKTVSAFANYHDGKIIIGIDDDHQIVGLDNPHDIKLNIENSINDALEPKPFYEIQAENIDGKIIIVLTVYKGDHTPYTVNQKAYKRSDTSTVQVDRFAYEELILLGRNQSYDGLNSANQDLEFLFLGSKLKTTLDIRSFSEDLLTTLGLKAKGKYNNAAALLSDKNPIQSSALQLIAYRDESVVHIEDRQTLNEVPLFKQFDDCMNFYHKHINTSEIINGAYRKTMEEVPLVAYREAVANLIVHRDYSKNIEGRIEFFSNRIEVISPGGLPIGILENEYLEGRISLPRNRVIAEIFLRLKIIEKLATGIRRIKEYYQDYIVKPVFTITENSITVILPKVNSVQNDLKPDVKRALKQNERLIYDLLQTNGAMKRADIELVLGLKKSQTVDLLNNLKEYQLISQFGNGPATKYILCK
jgi:ATP-dependent DNA helicase RecG